MRRGGPLRRSGGLRRKTPLRSRSERQAAADEALAESRRVARNRAAGFCEAAVPLVCRGLGHHAHHVQPRSRGRDDSPRNLMWVCFACHDWIHANPAKAKQRGWLT